MIKAIIFDMDGLMIDSEKVTFQSYQHILKQSKLTISKEFYCTLLGKPITQIGEQFYKVYGENFPFEETIKKVHTHMAETFETKGIPLKKGLLTLLQYLKENNYKTIVATSSQRKRADKILASANITKYFDQSICGDEVTNGKPNPEIFLKACQKLNVGTSEAIVLEDSEPGIQAAYDANIKVICIPDMKYPEKQFQEKAFTIVDSLEDIIPILKKG